LIDRRRAVRGLIVCGAFSGPGPSIGYGGAGTGDALVRLSVVQALALNVRSVDAEGCEGTAARAAFGHLAGVLEEAGEEEGGDLVGAALLDLVALGEGEEGVADSRVGSEEEAELGELGGAAAVLEGVEVAARCAGAGAAASLAGPGHRFGLIRHGERLPSPSWPQIDTD
jgi:hypothetical protein